MRPALFVRGDLDGFFGLFIDNLLQLMLIAVLCTQACSLPRELVTGRILPAAAISILAGNLFYAWQARRLMARSGRDDATALPYGINTPSLLAYVIFIMAPIYRQTHDATLAWRAGLAACVGSGLIETAGAFAGDWLRRHTPRAALLSALAGIAIAFISMEFVFQIYARPAVAVVPMMLILAAYAGRLRLPLGVPGGLLAVLIGAGVAWISRALGATWFVPAAQGPASLALHLPSTAFGDALALLSSPLAWQYASIIVPMGLFNVVGSLQNLESAEAAGDRYETRPSLLANGIGSLIAAFLGSPFPTTIYIGHPGWKAMGARAGYSALNGIVIALVCMTGGVDLVLRLVPLEAMLGILVWIGIIITAQAFTQVPARHALAVAIGLVPALAAWGLTMVEKALGAAGASLYTHVDKFGAGLYIRGVISLSQGFLLTSMILSSVLVFIVEHQFLRAAGWMLAGAVLSMVGLIHACELTAGGVRTKLSWAAAPDFAAVYALVAGLLVAFHLMSSRRSGDAP